MLAKSTKIIYNEDYKDESGLARSFRRFFDDLPDWIHTSLFDIYFIEKGEVLQTWFDRDNSNWIKASRAEKLKRIHKHFYERVRNTYTHTVDYYPTSEKGGILGMYFNGAQYSFNSFHQNADINKRPEWSVGLKTGIAESDVVRFLVVYHLRKLLGIQDDEALIERYWSRAQYRQLLFSLLQELTTNHTIIEYWCSIHLHRQTDQWSYGPISNLQDKVATSLATYINTNVPSENQILRELRSYISYIEQINTKIAEFNAQFIPPQDNPPHISMNDFLTGITQSSELVWCFQHLRNLEQVIPQILSQAIY